MTDDVMGKCSLQPDQNLLASVAEVNFAPIVAFLRKTLSVSETPEWGTRQSSKLDWN